MDMLREFIINSMDGGRYSSFSDDTRVYSYAEILTRANSSAQILSSSLPRKSKCAILCDSNFNTALALLSCWLAEMVPVTLSRNYGERHCLGIIEVLNPDLVITDNGMAFQGNTYDLVSAKLTILRDPGIPEAELCDVASILFTSGTTGIPKGAMISESGIIANVLDIAKYFRITDTDTMMIARPLYHCAVLTGEFLISLYVHANIHFCDTAYYPSRMLSVIEERNVSVMGGTPTLFQHLSNLIRKQGNGHTVKSMAISGECLTREGAGQIRAGFHDADIYNVYGLTEASPRVSYLDPSLFDQFPEYVGVSLASVSLRIVDSSGNLVPDGSDGVLQVRGPNVMKGYYRNPELTEKTIVDGWLNTGDICSRNEHGLIRILGRADDMIIKAGMNIYPAEIENSLRRNSAIKEVVAYRIRVRAGQEIGIDVVLAEGFKGLTVRDIYIICGKELPPYQLPSRIRLTESLKKNASGKLVRPRE